MIINSIEQINNPDLFFRLTNYIPSGNVYLKLEGLNIAGSIKIKTAINMLDQLESLGKIQPNSVIIESSSGNLGIALSIVCKNRGYPFICVSDPNMLQTSQNLIRANHGKLVIIDKKDENGGYLASRKQYIKQLLASYSNYIWLNQYENEANPGAHFTSTAVEIVRQFPKLNYLFIGTGTTGTLNGCIEYFKYRNMQTKIIAVEPEGSVTYGMPSKKRFIPGIGTSSAPKISIRNKPFDISFIQEIDTIHSCHYLHKKYSLLLGGSSGTVARAIWQYRHKFNDNTTVVGICADFGEKYLDTIYNPQWIKETYPDYQHQAAQVQSSELII